MGSEMCIRDRSSTTQIQASRGSLPLQLQPLLTFSICIWTDALQHLESCIGSSTGQQSPGVGKDHLKAVCIGIELQQAQPQLAQAIVQPLIEGLSAARHQLAAITSLQKLRKGFFRAGWRLALFRHWNCSQK